MPKLTVEGPESDTALAEMTVFPTAPVPLVTCLKLPLGRKYLVFIVSGQFVFTLPQLLVDTLPLFHPQPMLTSSPPQLHVRQHPPDGSLRVSRTPSWGVRLGGGGIRLLEHPN